MHKHYNLLKTKRILSGGLVLIPAPRQLRHWNAARQWPLIAVSHAVLYCVKRSMRNLKQLFHKTEKSIVSVRRWVWPMQGHRGSDRAVKLRAMETYKNQKTRFQLYSFLFSSNVDLKNNNKIIEKHSKFSGCANSCNKLVSSRFWKTMKLPTILLWKGTSAPVAPLLKSQVELLVLRRSWTNVPE